MREIGDLLRGGREPVELGVGDHGVEGDQALRDTARREWSPMRAVGLIDSAVQREVVQVIEPTTIVSTPVRGDVPAADQLVEKRARFLSMDNAGERRILP